MTGKHREHNTIKAMMGHLSSLEDELEEDDVELLAKVFRSQTFKALLKVDKVVETVKNKGPLPVSSNAFNESKQLYWHLRRKRNKSSLIEALADCLENSHIQALLSAHDLIATEQLIPRKADIDNADLDRLRVIRIEKETGEPLGATIRRNDINGRVVIARILQGGAAQRTGLLHQGDEICEVNGISTDDLSLDGVVSLLSLDSQNVEFKILTSAGSLDNQVSSDKLFMRAHFSYDPFEDPHIPCKDAGLAFSKGEILEITDCSEPRWWQARRYGSKSTKTGLIPSKQLQERRLALSLWSPHDSFTGLSETSSRSLSPRDKNVLNDSLAVSPTSKATKKKSKKVKFQIFKSGKFRTEEIVIYEEVTQVMADFDRPRPVIITGAEGIGCEEFRRKLVETDPEKFESPITYTSRSRKSHERAEKDYHFISRYEFEKRIHCNEFVNIEATKNHFFAISIESIREIVDARKTCVIFLNPEYLRNLCGTSLHPFVVFIKAPSIEILETSQQLEQDKVLFQDRITNAEDVCKLSLESEEIENNYGHYFDLIITNNDAETTINQLYHSVNKIATEPFWVPVR